MHKGKVNLSGVLKFGQEPRLIAYYGCSTPCNSKKDFMKFKETTFFTGHMGDFNRVENNSQT